jgi:hypothetical protein
MRPMSKAKGDPPRVAQLTVSSKNKIRQVLLRMLTEAGLLAKGNSLGTIQRPALSPAVFRVIVSDNPELAGGIPCS